MDKGNNCSFDWDMVKKKAIELIIEVRTKGENTVEEYSSSGELGDLKKEVEHYLKYVKNTDHPLSYFNGRMSDDDLAKYICQLATTSFGEGNRKLIHNLNKKGMKFDFTHLPVKVESTSDFNLSPDLENKLIEMEDDLIGKNIYYNPKIREIDIIELIQSYRHKDYKDLVWDLLYENNLMFRTLIDEKARATKAGLDSVYYIRISQYIDFSYVMVSEFLFYIITSYFDVGRKASLQKVIDYMDNIFPLKRKEESSASYQKIVVNENGDTVSPAPVAFRLWLDKKQIFDEENQIEKVLEEDMGKNKEIFLLPKSFLHNRVSEYETERKLILDLIDKNHVHDVDYRKLKEAKEFIKRWGEKDGSLGYEDDIYLLYMVFREIFVNKAKLPDKEKNLTALIIARTFLQYGEENLRRWDEVFINKKFLRGRFWVLGLQEEYYLYNRIMQKYRKTLLDVFYTLNDIDCYKLIHDIGESIINFFCVYGG